MKYKYYTMDKGSTITVIYKGYSNTSEDILDTGGAALVFHLDIIGDSDSDKVKHADFAIPEYELQNVQGLSDVEIDWFIEFCYRNEKFFLDSLKRGELEIIE